MRLSRGLGLRLLGLLLLVKGLVFFLTVSISGLGTILDILAIVAGILILIG